MHVHLYGYIALCTWCVRDECHVSLSCMQDTTDALCSGQNLLNV